MLPIVFLTFYVKLKLLFEMLVKQEKNVFITNCILITKCSVLSVQTICESQSQFHMKSSIPIRIRKGYTD